MSILLRLAFWQLKNTLRDALTNPRKLIPLTLLAAVLAWSGYVVLTAPPGTFAPKNAFPLLEAHRADVHDAVFVLLVLLAASVLDRGLAGGSLIYSPGDREYLFPAPFPRRLVLAFKLLSPVPGILLAILYAAVRPSAGLPVAALPPWAISLAFFAGAGGCQNLAVAAEMTYGLGRSPRLRRVLLAALALLLAYIGFLARRHGAVVSLTDAAHGPLLVLFYPAHLIADVLVPPAPGGNGWPALGQLLLFYGLTLAAVFLRSPDFYETAAIASERVLRAQKAQVEGNWLTLFQTKKRTYRPYSLPPWGRGVGAVVWAHLAAAAKTPFVNFVLPAALGVTLGIVALRSDHEGASMLVIIFPLYYLLGTTVGGGLFYFRRSLLRQPLVRPLPLPADLVVLAEVLPRVLMAAPFYLACGLLLLVGRGDAVLASALLSLPLVSLALSLLQYGIALSYPSLEDKLQAALAQGFQLLLAMLLTAALALFFAVPALAGASASVSLLVFVAGCSATTLLLWRTTARAYRAYPPDGNRMPLTKTTVKRLLKPTLVVLLISGLAIGVGRSVSKSLHKPPTPPRTVATRVGDIVIQVSETGTIEPVDKVDVKSKAAGRLLRIPIQEGQYVRQGQLIALVDRSQIDPQLARDQAQLQQAQARLTQTEAEYALQVRQTQAAIAQAQAGLAQAQAHLAVVQARARPQELAQGREAVARAQIVADDALRTQKRRASLLARGFISQADYDSSQVAVDTAQSSLDTAKQQLGLTAAGPRVQDVADARAQVETARVQLEGARANEGQNAVKRSDIAQARASVAQISGDIQQLDVNVADTRILAPSSGLVLKKYKEPNEIVQSATTGFSDAQSIVATLGSRLEVKVGINEVDIAKVRAHAPAVITVDALPGASFAGYVTEIAPASTNAFADASGGSSGGANSISKFSVKVAFARYDPRLRSGMSANVSVISQKRSHVVLAPLEAVPFTGLQGQVSVLDPLGRPQKRTVVTGLRNDTDVEVMSGLKAGEKLVVPPISGAGRRKTDITDNSGG